MVAVSSEHKADDATTTIPRARPRVAKLAAKVAAVAARPLQRALCLCHLAVVIVAVEVGCQELELLPPPGTEHVFAYSCSRDSP